MKLAFDFAPLPIRAVLYLYAESGPAVFIPAGQRLGAAWPIVVGALLVLLTALIVLRSRRSATSGRRFVLPG